MISQPKKAARRPPDRRRLPRGPSRLDVDVPKQAEDPDRGKAEGAMQCQRPRLQRAPGRAEAAGIGDEVCNTSHRTPVSQMPMPTA
jgi:hypothetical protein